MNSTAPAREGEARDSLLSVEYRERGNGADGLLASKKTSMVVGCLDCVIDHG